MTSKRAHRQVAVLGAGITGLSAGLHLQRQGVSYCILERSHRVGGHAVTEEDSGFHFDRTGHLLHLRDSSMRQLVCQLLGDAFLVIQRRSRIWLAGGYTRYPFQANTHGLPPKIAYECLMGFLEAHYGTPRPAPQNFEEFCLAHFGKGFSEHFMLPYNSRLWGVPPYQISSEWCQRFVPLPTLEDVVAGAVGMNARELGYNSSFIYPTQGIGALPEAMARRIPHIQLGHSVERVFWRQKYVVSGGQELSYQQLISTLPLPHLVHLMDDVPPEITQHARALRGMPLYYLDVALNTECRQDFHWIYVPESKYPFYRVGCYSQFSRAMAPTGKSSLYVELVQRTQPVLESLMPEVAQALTEMDLISGPDQIQFARLRQIDPAYVIYDFAHSGAVSALHSFLSEHGIQSTGRYGAWNYSSMEDALLMGQAAAQEALRPSAAGV